MDEKILIKSQSYHTKRTVSIILLVLLVVWFWGNCVYCAGEVNEEMGWMEAQLKREEGYYNEHKALHSSDDIGCKLCKEYEEDVQEAINRIEEFNPIVYSLEVFWEDLTYFIFRYVPCWSSVSLVGIALICWLITWWLKSYELTVTDKRVYGKVAFGKRVDLPYDSISAISTFGLLKGISVATSSGSIAFLLVKNADEVYKVLNRLLLERQESKKAVPAKEVIAAPSNAAELKQYKELLDSGVISQEEFDAKKKQLLGL